MTFQRIRRGLVDQRKPEPVSRDEIVLMWTDNPPSPCLSLYLGNNLAQAIGLRTSGRVQLFIGHGEDAGRVGIKRAIEWSDGDYRSIPRTHGAHRIYLSSHTSVTHFAFCPRTTIPASRIELRGDMLVFDYRGLKVDPHRSYRDDR